MNINQTNMTPGIIFTGGELIIRGRSIPEDAVRFYEPLKEELKKYVENPLAKTFVKIDMDYINTSSSMVILEMLKLFSETPDVQVEWVYEEDDEDIKELGEFYEEFSKLSFKFIEKK